jgi:hypothetical protein
MPRGHLVSVANRVRHCRTGSEDVPRAWPRDCREAGPSRFCTNASEAAGAEGAIHKTDSSTVGGI